MSFHLILIAKGLTSICFGLMYYMIDKLWITDHTLSTKLILYLILFGAIILMIMFDLKICISFYNKIKNLFFYNT